MIHIALTEDDITTLLRGGVVEQTFRGNIVSGPVTVKLTLADIGFLKLSQIIVDAVGAKKETKHDQNHQY